ncbi:hypothetical protein ACVKXF_001057 [Curtobacterium sp. PvP017]
MSISSKTRKLLWSHAHDMCALCKRRLTGHADSSILSGLVFGEEAHIIARRKDGPRGEEGSREGLDDYRNLILLCADDHKRVDEQPNIFTVDVLRDMKDKHIEWAASKYREASESEAPKPIRTLAADGEESIPMIPMQSGRQIWELIEGAGLRYFRSVEGDTTPEAATAADELLDAAAGWADISDTVIEHGFSAVRRVHQNLQELLEDVQQEKLVVYGRRVIRVMTGGYAPDMPLPTVHLVVLTAEELANNSESDGSLLV